MVSLPLVYFPFLFWVRADVQTRGTGEGVGGGCNVLHIGAGIELG